MLDRQEQARPRRTRSLSPELEQLAHLQEELAARVLECPLPGQPTWVAGVDVHLSGDKAVAVAVCFELLTRSNNGYKMHCLPLREVGQSVTYQNVTFPYIPGFLSFREAPVIVEAVKQLPIKPDLLLVDGQGQAHPRGCGLASHVGVLLDLPTIGAAKSRLFGSYREPGVERGAWSPLLADHRVIGAVVRTRSKVRPIFVSVGHRITLEEAIFWVLQLSCYRVPEPTRWAHRYAKQLAQRKEEGFQAGPPKSAS